MIRAPIPLASIAEIGGRGSSAPSLSLRAFSRPLPVWFLSAHIRLIRGEARGPTSRISSLASGRDGGRCRGLGIAEQIGRVDQSLAREFDVVGVDLNSEATGGATGGATGESDRRESGFVVCGASGSRTNPTVSGTSGMTCADSGPAPRSGGFGGYMRPQ